MGDPSKLLLLDAVVKVVQRDGLLESTAAVGRNLLSSLEKLQNQFPHILSNARGLGTFCSIDCPDVKTRDAILEMCLAKGQLNWSWFFWKRILHLQLFLSQSWSWTRLEFPRNIAGVHIGGCGESTIRFRPCLIFKEQHLSILLSVLQSVVKSVWQLPYANTYEYHVCIFFTWCLCK